MWARWWPATPSSHLCSTHPALSPDSMRCFHLSKNSQETVSLTCLFHLSVLMHKQGTYTPEKGSVYRVAL